MKLEIVEKLAAKSPSKWSDTDIGDMQDWCKLEAKSLGMKIGGRSPIYKEELTDKDLDGIRDYACKLLEAKKEAEKPKTRRVREPEPEPETRRIRREPKVEPKLRSETKVKKEAKVTVTAKVKTPVVKPLVAIMGELVSTIMPMASSIQALDLEALENAYDVLVKVQKDLARFIGSSADAVGLDDAPAETSDDDEDAVDLDEDDDDVADDDVADDDDDDDEDFGDSDDSDDSDDDEVIDDDDFDYEDDE